MQKNKLSVWQIMLISFGTIGISHGFSIQFARMSSIYEKLGASIDEIPLLWLAAPLTGFIVQPLIGYLSDRTWGNFGRRKPYILIGTILCVTSLFIMPNASILITAVLAFWLLSFAIDFTMHPFKTLIGDVLPEEQVSLGYSVQTIMAGISGAIAYWIVATDWLNVSSFFKIFAPSSLHIQFYLVGIIFIITVIVSLFTLKEYPPSDIEQFKKDKKESKGFLIETYKSIIEMPKPMKALAIVQFFTWCGLFCMWMYYSVAVAHRVFGSLDPHSTIYEAGIQFASKTWIAYQVVSTVFAFFVPYLSKKIGAPILHTICLAIGAIGLLSVWFISNPNLLYVSMGFIGIAWASILCIPYTILVSTTPSTKLGVYMGVFNLFIVIPQIITSLFIGKLMNLLETSSMGLILAGLFMLLASIISLTVLRTNYMKAKTA